MRFVRSAFVLAVAAVLLLSQPGASRHGVVEALPGEGGATDFVFTSHTCPDIQFETLLKLVICTTTIEGEMQAPEDGPFYWAGLRNEEFSCSLLFVTVRLGGKGSRVFVLPPGTEISAQKLPAQKQAQHIEVEITGIRTPGKPACKIGTALGWSMSMAVSTHLFEPITFDATVQGRTPDRASPGDTIKYKGSGWTAGAGPIKVFLGNRLLKSFPPRSFAGSFKWTGLPKADTCGTILRAQQGTGEGKTVRMIALGEGPVLDFAWAKGVNIAGQKPRKLSASGFVCAHEAEFIRLDSNAEFLMMPLATFDPTKGQLGDLPDRAYSRAFNISAYNTKRRVEIGNIVAPVVVLHSTEKITHTMYGESFAAWADEDPCAGTFPVCPPSVTELSPPGQFFPDRVKLEGSNRAHVDVEFRKGARFDSATLWGGYSIYVTGDGPLGGVQGKGTIYAGNQLTIVGPLELTPEDRTTIGVYNGVLTIKGCGTCGGGAAAGVR